MSMNIFQLAKLFMYIQINSITLKVAKEEVFNVMKYVLVWTISSEGIKHLWLLIRDIVLLTMAYALE